LSSFKIIDSRRFPLEYPGDNLSSKDYYRFEHKATISLGIRRYMVVVDQLTQNIHYHDITSGTDQTIEDDQIFNELNEFCEEQGLLSMQMPIFKNPYPSINPTK
jgi:hypothetical protein